MSLTALFPSTLSCGMTDARMQDAAGPSHLPAPPAPHGVEVQASLNSIFQILLVCGTADAIRGGDDPRQRATGKRLARQVLSHMPLVESTGVGTPVAVAPITLNTYQDVGQLVK